MTARKSAPAATRPGALSGVMPPIATRGSSRPALSRSRPGWARRASGLVPEGKEGAEGEVVGPGRGCGMGAAQVVVAGGTQAQAGGCGAGFGQVAVVAAQVGTLGAYFERQPPIIVHYQRDAGLAAQRQHGPGLLAAQRGAGGFVPVLQQHWPLGQRGAQAGQQPRGVGFVGGDQVQAALRPGDGGVHFGTTVQMREW